MNAQEVHKEEGEEKMALPPYMRQSQPPPPVQIGQTIEARIDSIELVKGQYGKQYQFMLTLTIQGNQHQQRAWVKHYDTPTPKTKLGKLCLAVHRVTQGTHQSVQSAIDALKTYGRVFVTVTKFTTADDGTMYPRFGIIADYLPGEQPGQTTPTTLPQQQVNPPLPPQSGTEDIIQKILSWKPTLTRDAVLKLIEGERAKAAGLLTEEAAAYLVASNLGVDNEPTPDSKMRAWIAENQGLIGQAIPSSVYNVMNTVVIDELVKNKLAYSKNDMPHLDDRAKEFL